MSRATQILSIAIVITACTDRVTLDVVGRTETLTYRCGHFESQRNSPKAEEIVREQSQRIVRQALQRGDQETVDRLTNAYESSTLQVLEELVVDYSCQHGVVPEWVRVPVFPEVGSAARDFELPTLTLEPPYDNGPTVRLLDYRGSVVVLDVFGIWCPPCLERYPATAATAGQYKGKGAEFFGLLLSSPRRQSAEWFRENGGLAYPFLVDREFEVKHRWRLRGAPAMFVIDQRGFIADRCLGCQSGPLSVDSLPIILDSLLQAGGHAP
jgi:peroxiredoxin